MVDIFAALVVPSQIATSSVFGAVILPDAVCWEIKRDPVEISGIFR